MLGLPVPFVRVEVIHVPVTADYANDLDAAGDGAEEDHVVPE